MDLVDNLFVSSNGNGTVKIFIPPYTGTPIALSGHALTNPRAVFLGP
jgi:hypothetical protein